MCTAVNCETLKPARALRILQVSTSDIGGGAERIGWQLFQAYRKRGFPSWIAVGIKRSNDSDVFIIPNDAHQNGLTRLLLQAVDRVARFRSPGLRQALRRGAELLSKPGRFAAYRRGEEDFDFPGTPFILDLPPQRPDILHCHNLHRNYFDLRALPGLSAQVPIVLTLHDAWLLSGHCAHSFDCVRWQTGCGVCPDLTIHPPIKRDATAFNWRRKRDIYARSRFYVAAPSRWLMDKVAGSMLAPAMVESRVIPNGMDLSVFCPPRDRQAVRAELGIPPDTPLLLFVASGIRNNIWKDFQTLRAVVGQVSERLDGRDVLFLALGEDAPSERVGSAWVRFIPYQESPEKVAHYYQAADVYVHAARVDTFPNTVIEALACGVPVVATAVGGIPEQIRSLEAIPAYGADEATGILVRADDAEAMTAAVVRLLTDEPLRRQLGNNAARDARQRFDLERQVDAYLEWYREIVSNMK